MTPLNGSRSARTTRSRRTRSLAALCLAALLLTTGSAGAARVGANVALELVADGYDSPVFVIGDPSRPGHLFVVEQNGRIRRIVDGRKKTRPFLDIRSKVSAGGERGLLSMAFAPGWPQQRHVFVNYTDTAGNTVVARHTVNRKLTRARRKGARVLTVEQPFANHNGGQLQVGPDGFLYIGMGDGGGGGDPVGAGQDLTTQLGKLLRLDVSSLPATVPADNPSLPGVGRTAIWALGLRNPWRFSFDRGTGDLYIADVGQNAREEVDFQPADSAGGENYGWAVREGNLPFDDSVTPATTPLTDPIHDYGRADGFSITGGYVYRGEAIPELDGYYLFADFGSRRIWAFRVRNGRARDLTELTAMLVSAQDRTPAVSSFGEDVAGELYLCDYFDGAVYRIVPG
jgi:glucose/arabinose dehydrogenase